VIQCAKKHIQDKGSLFDAMTQSEILRGLRKTATDATRVCVLVEGPDLVAEVVARHDAHHHTSRRLCALLAPGESTPLCSQKNPGNEVPEEHCAYRFAIKQ